MATQGSSVSHTSDIKPSIDILVKDVANDPSSTAAPTRSTPPLPTPSSSSMDALTTLQSDIPSSSPTDKIVTRNKTLANNYSNKISAEASGNDWETDVLASSSSEAGYSTPVNISTPQGPSTGRRKRGKGISPSEVITDDKTPMNGVVIAYGPRAGETPRRVTFPSKMPYVYPNIPYKNGSWTHQKILGDGDFIASGFVFIQVNGMKDLKNAKDNTYVFIVLEGTVEAKVHKSSYIICSGGVFQVPRGNNYSIKNISSRDVKLFFVQGRRTPVSFEEDHGSLLPPHLFDKPASKTLMLLHWLLPRLATQSYRIRTTCLTWYQRYLAKYKRFLAGRRLYFLFFLFGLMLRRLPFVGSPPLVNIQFIRIP